MVIGKLTFFRHAIFHLPHIKRYASTDRLFDTPSARTTIIDFPQLTERGAYHMGTGNDMADRLGSTIS